MPESPDVAVKAAIEEHMDERRTGEDGYRRPVLEARNANPQRPGQPIEPFGYTQAEAKVLVEGTGVTYAGTLHREALGNSVRRYSNSGGKITKPPATALPAVERIRRSATRLDDGDLADLIDALKQEQKRRRRNAP